MGQTLWPLFDLRLTTVDLTMRHLTEADLPELARVVPDDLEMDPQAHVYAGMEPREQRGLILAQRYWRELGTWKPDSWAMMFAVFSGGELVGTQGLEGEDFPVLRTVDSSSFLVPSARSRGWGKQMRRAVLGLAFGPLGAQYAITSAWHDNAASLGVSRALGYTDNGVERHRRGGPTEPGGSIDTVETVDDMVHLRLSRAEWERHGGAGGLRIEGFEACKPLFAL